MRISVFVAKSFAALVLVGLLPAPVSAASQPLPTTGITISPFQEQLSITADDSGKTFNLNLTNHTAGLQEINLSARDFGTLNDTGGVFLEGSNNYTQKYGLTSWMTLGTDTVVLQPKESQTVPVTVSNRPDLQPGGHYGAVVASVNSLADQSGTKVAINQQLLSLVFVDKVGGERYDLKLTSMQQNGNWLHFPNAVTLRFQNPGNVHITPRGLVKLKSPSGKVIAQGMINTESSILLPESYREIYVPLKKVGSAYPIPGLYHIEVDYRYEQINRYAVKSYAVPFIDLGLYLVLAVLLSGSLWFFIRRYQKHPKTS